MNEYKTTTAWEKIVKLNKPVNVIQGGQGAGKTIGILMYFIQLAIAPVSKDLTLSVVSHTLPHLKSGAIKDFEKLLKSMGLYSKFKINATDKTYKYGSNTIEFFSVDGEASRMGSRRNYLYVNEADFITFDTFNSLSDRSDVTYLDYNPRKRFWAHSELIGQDHVAFLQLTYLDNEFLKKSEVKTLLRYKGLAESTGRKYYINKWKVYGLGELGIADGLIFENWDEIKKLPEGAKYLGAGLDFGYSNDPTAIIKIYKFEDKIILVESLYKKGLLNSAIARHILNDSELKNGIIICDSSEPKTIAELRTYGIHIMGVKKGKGSIISGIQIMQEFQLLVIGKNLVEEFSNYCYQKDRSGESLGIPIDDFNHGIDGARYFFMERLSKSANNYNTLRWVS